MTAAWLPPGKQTFVDANGKPLVGGFVNHYIPSTSTRKDTWQDYAQVSLNANPIVLDAKGQCIIWGSGAYRQVLTDSLGNEIWDRPTTVGQAANTLAAGQVWGMTLQNNTGNPTTQIDVALGQARDSTNTADIVLTGAITKSLTAVWAAGSGNGGRDSGTALAAAQSYHVHVIYNPTSGAVDALFSQSATAPNLPNGYTYFRRVGSLPVLGGANIPPSGTGIPTFKQWGDQFLLASPNNEWTAQTGSAAPALKLMYVPLGIKVRVLFFSQMVLSPVVSGVLFRVTDPDLGLPPAFGTGNQFGQMRMGTAETYLTNVFQETTNTAGQVYVQVSDATMTWALKSRGWIDTRGQFG